MPCANVRSSPCFGTLFGGSSAKENFCHGCWGRTVSLSSPTFTDVYKRYERLLASLFISPLRSDHSILLLRPDLPSGMGLGLGGTERAWTVVGSST
jgi:hypothetical protein